MLNLLVFSITNDIDESVGNVYKVTLSLWDQVLITPAIFVISTNRGLWTKIPSVSFPDLVQLPYLPIGSCTWSTRHLSWPIVLIFYVIFCINSYQEFRLFPYQALDHQVLPEYIGLVFWLMLNCSSQRPQLLITAKLSIYPAVKIYWTDSPIEHCIMVFRPKVLVWYQAS